MATIILFGLGAALYPKSAFAGEILSLSKYINRLLIVSELYQSEQQKLIIAESQQRVTEDFFQSSLKIEGSQTHSGQDFRGGATDPFDQYFRYSNIFVGIKQDTSWGMDIQIGLTDRLDDVIYTSSILNNDRVLKISQDLWKNGFGKLQKLKAEQAHKALVGTRATLRAKKLELCEAGVIQYIKLFEAQQKVKTFVKMNQLAEKSSQFISRSFRKRMVRKIDYLKAKTDHLRLKAQLESNTKDLNKESILLAKSIHSAAEWGNKRSESPIKVMSPMKSIAKWKIASVINIGNHSSLVAARAAVTAQQLAVRVAHDDAETELAVGLDLGIRETQLHTQTPAQDIRENYLVVKLALDWPFNNQTHRERILQANSGLILAQKSYALRRKSFQSEYFKNRSDLTSLNKIFSLSIKQLKGYQKQIQEAEKLLFAGKLEFESYVRYRDAYLNQEIGNIELQSALWGTKLALVQLNNQVGEICMEGVHQ